jgi:PqqD family protein of HPr-rel-A system
MRVSGEMYVEWVEGEAVVLNRDSGELHYLNGPAALVFALIQEHGYDAALSELRDRFGTAEGMQEELEKLIGEMVEKEILVDD